MSMIGTFALATDDEIRGLLATPEELGDFLEQRDEAMDGRALDIDKSWHGLHWLLTGTEDEGEPPLNFILMGGTEIGEEEYGYSVPRALTGDEVQRIDTALDQISTADLLARYDGNAMRELYPNVWDRADEREINLDYLGSYFESLKGFIARAREQAQGLIVYLT
jgi:hypothetical protein